MTAEPFPSRHPVSMCPASWSGRSRHRPGGGQPSRTRRAEVLRAVAARLDGASDELVGLARSETQLGEARLEGELARTTFQLRFLAGVVEDGDCFEAAIDSPEESWPPGSRPDLRRILRPIGPVAVFAASNFPFAFSVAGGDTASALAAGCTVVLKAHPGHPRLSARCAEIVVAAMEKAGAPGAFSCIAGDEAGRALVDHPDIAAVAFTGSQKVGRLLFDLAVRRPKPIPFYGELGSVNPVFVTRRAAAGRMEEIAKGYVASFTLGAGQFCTQPGVLFLPTGHLDTEGLAALVGAAGARASAQRPHRRRLSRRARGPARPGGPLGGRGGRQASRRLLDADFVAHLARQARR